MTDGPPPPIPDDLPPPAAGTSVSPPAEPGSGRSPGRWVLVLLFAVVAASAIVLWVLRSPSGDSADPVDSIPPIPTAPAEGSEAAVSEDGTDGSTEPSDATTGSATGEAADPSGPTLAPAATIVVEAPSTTSSDSAEATTTVPPGPPEIVVPSDGASIVEILEASPGLARVAELVIVAEARDDLAADDESYTLLAPTNAAIDALLATDERYGQLDDPVLLRELLDRHLVTDAIGLDALLARDEVRTLSGETLTIGDGTIGGAVVVTGDVVAGNGVIHVIDAIAVATG